MTKALHSTELRLVGLQDKDSPGKHSSTVHAMPRSCYAQLLFFFVFEGMKLTDISEYSFSSPKLNLLPSLVSFSGCLRALFNGGDRGAIAASLTFLAVG